MIRHHPEHALLLDYAAGTAPEAVALAVAVHLALCSECRTLARGLESAGGALLERLPAAELGPGALDAVFARIDGEEARPGAIPEPRADDVPAPLRAYVNGSLDDQSWRRFGNTDVVFLSVGQDRSWQTSLLRMQPGIRGPRHTHRGVEYTVLLQGAYFDGIDRYAAGDFAAADPTLNHAPTAEPGPACIALSVQDAPIRLTGRFGRLLNPVLSAGHGRR